MVNHFGLFWFIFALTKPIVDFGVILPHSATPIIIESNKARYTAIQSRMGGQGSYLRSFEHLCRSSEAKDRKNQKKKGKGDGQTDGPTDRQSEVLSRVARD